MDNKDNNDLVEIVCIVDMSGSMHSIESDAIGGLNSFVEEQKELGDANFTLVLFNHEVETVVFDGELSNFEGLNKDNYKPFGMTAMLDAIGLTLDKIKGKAMESPKELEERKVVVAILTDGYENSSKEYTYDGIKKMTQGLTEKGWKFIYLGANQDAIEEGSRLGIVAESSINFDATGDGIRSAYANTSKLVSEYRGDSQTNHINININNEYSDSKSDSDEIVRNIIDKINKDFRRNGNL